ncbi:MAG: pilin [Patescibacteria group bacterium]|nr:pilin [Patescibacteria group bacterium]
MFSLKLFKLTCKTLSTSAIALLLSASPIYAQQRAWTGVCVGSADSDVATIQGLECLIANVFTVIITLIGVAAFVMFVVGSLTWLTAGGNSNNMEKAKKSFTYAVVGIVVALSAFIIINLIASFTGVNIIRNFSIPTS